MRKRIKTKVLVSTIYLISFLVIYLVIGFFVKSSYPPNNYLFNYEEAFNVLQSGLSLVGTFSTIAIAWILYGVWRNEHRDKQIEFYALEVLERLKILENQIHKIFMDIDCDYESQRLIIGKSLDEVFSEKLLKIKILHRSLKKYKDVTNWYCTLLDNVNWSIEKCESVMVNLVLSKDKITHPEIYHHDLNYCSMEQYINDERSKYKDLEVQWNDHYGDIKGLIVLLDNEIDNLLI